MKPFFALVSSFCLTLLACSPEKSRIEANTSPASQLSAFGAPGEHPYWSYAGKTGIGTSYEAYNENGFNDQHPTTGNVSKVWFSLAQGGITEVMYGLIHEAQLKDLQFVVVGENFVDIDQLHTKSDIRYLAQDDAGRPLAPAYTITNWDRENIYTLQKDIFTDPDNQTLFVRVTAQTTQPISVYAVLNPHMNNDGWGDRAWQSPAGLHSEDSGVFLTLATEPAFTESSVGFEGNSDGITDLNDGKLDWHFSNTGEQRGNVVLTAKLFDVKPNETHQNDLVIGFGASETASVSATKKTLAAGYKKVLANYVGTGDAVGWQDYLKSLDHLPALQKTATDGGALLNASALVLKVQEDKTHAGALIASLSNPWGDTVSAAKGATGYKAVWPRDFYQCAMALLALGDTQTPRVAFEYLKKIQVDENTPGNKGDGGWFLQKTHVDGEPEWVAVQLDQTAMPIMLGWKLWQHGVFTDEEIKRWFEVMLKPAANFLVHGGKLDLGWAEPNLKPPYTQQERWEEQAGYSPSTMAAIIAGLVSAADIATLSGEGASTIAYLTAADSYSKQLEDLTFTSEGVFGDGHYYLRATPNGKPNQPAQLADRNGRGKLNTLQILDGGFLELVRYGVRPANDDAITRSLSILNDQNLPEKLRVHYEFEFTGETGKFPGWRRYGDDGYGEDKLTGLNYGASGKNGGDGGGMSPDQRGRVWPFFTGEHAHYQLAAGMPVNNIRKRYVRAMELFANDGLMLPEQVWDGVGVNPANRYVTGEGTNGATPLAWTHAEYVKLLRSLSDGKVWDFYPAVGARYSQK
ncbi:glucoamylase [Alteromonadaceae bacterium 2753L.S.0a.02]|nr:glucoamylase [Alteromonadaceae bacterium 2753L.S.0a.02]